MKAEKKLPEPVQHDIVLTLTPEEARALYCIIEDFCGVDDDDYSVPGSSEQFDVTLHSELLRLGVNRE